MTPDCVSPQTYRSLLPEKGFPRWVPFSLWMAYVALLLVAVFHLRSIGNMNVETDFYWTYVPIARALLSGELLLDAFRGPGYEIVLAAMRLVVGEFFRAGLVLSVLSSGVTLLLLYAVLHRTFDAETAFLTSVGTAITPAFFSLSYTAGTDMFFVMLALSVLFLILRGEFTHGWMLLLAGLLAGYTYLTRYNGIAIIVAAGAGILWLCDPSLPWKRRIRSAALFLLGALVTIVPFSFYTHHLTGRYVYNNNFLNVAFEVYGKGIRWDDFWNVIAPHFHSYAEVVAYDPWGFMLHVGMNVFKHGWSDLTSLVLWPVGIAAAAGGVIMLRNGLTRRQAAVMLFAVLSFLVLIPVFYTQRFSLFLVPFIILLCVRFLQWRGTERIPERWFRYATLTIAIVLMLWTGLQSAYLLKQDIASEPAEILQVRDAFKGLTDDVPRGKSVSARKPHIAYYLDLAYAPFPYVTSEAELVSALRQEHVDYVYISYYEVATRPELKELLDSTREHDGLRALITVLSPPSVLYRVTP